jgi:hypothetical protein
MKILFSILSLFYIAAIFILAGSPVADTLSEFNPYSLLHIPLYGILASLLIFSMVPITQVVKEVSIQPNVESTRSAPRGTVGLTVRSLIAGGIALAVGIFDEIHQLSVPGRYGSVTDVALDLAGIALALFLCFRFFKTRLSRQTR